VVWTERDGPTVQEPTRRGFGSVILDDTARQFARSVSIDFVPAGLRYELRLPLPDIAASNQNDRAPSEPGSIAPADVAG
jgi:two-component sensor histidine kinase